MPSNRLIYIGYYDTEANAGESRRYCLAAAHKMNYILDAIGRSGCSAEIVSPSSTGSRQGYPARRALLDGGHTLVLFRTLPWGGKVRRVLSILHSRSSLLVWLLRNTAKGENVLVYHSLGYASIVAIAQTLRRFRLILEVEEVYADVTGKAIDRRAEQRVFRRAAAFIFPTEMLNDALNSSGRPYAVIHGTYRPVARMSGRVHDGRVHVVYAGTFDPRKGGALAAAAAAFLDEHYHVHILGFGSESDTVTLREVVRDVSGRTRCRLTLDGLMAGEEYSKFLQGCHIGLSTQNPDAEFNQTSFPSKILSYLAHGLHVVTVRIPAVEGSGVGDLVHYYESDSPEVVAAAIRSVDLQLPYDPHGRLRDLDRQFSTQLSSLLGDRKDVQHG